MTDAAPAQAASSTPAPQSAGLLADTAAPAAAPASNGSSAPAAPNGTQQGHNSGGHFDANGNWREGFAQGLDEETGKVWSSLSQRYTTPADMAKAHVSLVQTMDKRIPIPGDNAKPEEWDQVYNKLGRPETPDKYSFEFPADAPWDDGQKDHIKGLAPLFHKNGATQRQVNEFVKQQAELDKVANDAALAKANTLNQQRERQMQTEWRGEDYQRNRNLAATSVKHYAGADVGEAAKLRLDDGTFALDHPVFQRMFAKIGSEKSEDDRDPTAFNAPARESVKSQIDQIYAENASKGITPTDPRFPNAKVEELMRKAHGSRNAYGTNKAF